MGAWLPLRTQASGSGEGDHASEAGSAGLCARRGSQLSAGSGAASGAGPRSCHPGPAGRGGGALCSFFLAVWLVVVAVLLSLASCPRPYGTDNATFLPLPTSRVRGPHQGRGEVRLTAGGGGGCGFGLFHSAPRVGACTACCRAAGAPRSRPKGPAQKRELNVPPACSPTSQTRLQAPLRSLLRTEDKASRTSRARDKAGTPPASTSPPALVPAGTSHEGTNLSRLKAEHTLWRAEAPGPSRRHVSPWKSLFRGSCRRLG